MGPPIPTDTELLRFALAVRAKRKEAADKLLRERAMTRDELVQLGLILEYELH